MRAPPLQRNSSKAQETRTVPISVWLPKTDDIGALYRTPVRLGLEAWYFGGTAGANAKTVHIALASRTTGERT